MKVKLKCAICEKVFEVEDEQLTELATHYDGKPIEILCLLCWSLIYTDTNINLLEENERRD